MAEDRRTDGPNGKNQGRRRRRACQAALAAALMVIAPLGLAGPAFAGLGVSPVPDFPEITTVGDQFPARLNIFNTSTPPENAAPITVTEITLAPACSNNNPDCAGGVDAGVFTLGPVATGAPGSQCAGTTFNVVQTAPGLYTFVPSAPVVLTAGQSCVIDFQVTTTRTPSVDVLPGVPGIQTNVLATARAISPLSPAPFSGVGVDVVTVLAVQPTIATQANPQQVDVGEPFTDTATVTGPIPAPGAPPFPTPTGTVTFQLFGPTTPPAFPDCAGPPVFTSAPIPLTPGALNPAGAATATATGPPVTPQDNPGIPGDQRVGNYVWVATYSGDANFLPVTSACNDPAEQVTVQALPTILVEKTATPLTMQEPGGTFTFDVVVTNTSAEPVTITSLNDNIYGNIANQGTCTTAVGTVLAPGGGTYSCSFQGNFTGLAPASQTDIVTAVATTPSSP